MLRMWENGLPDALDCFKYYWAEKVILPPSFWFCSLTVYLVGVNERGSLDWDPGRMWCCQCFSQGLRTFEKLLGIYSPRHLLKVVAACQTLCSALKWLCICRMYETSVNVSQTLVLLIEIALFLDFQQGFISNYCFNNKFAGINISS